MQSILLGTVSLTLN